MSLADRRRRDAEAFKRAVVAAVQGPFRVLDATQIDEPSNSDEALAQAVEYAQPGDRITVHAADCPTTRDSAWRCRCEPVVVEVGAEA